MISLKPFRGNDHNIGIYQRVHGDNAEAACLADYGSDGFVFGGRRFMAPSRDNPAAYTQAFVERRHRPLQQRRPPGDP